MKPFTFTVPVSDPASAIAKAKAFFESQGVKSDGNTFKNDDWEGRYRIIDGKLEITILDKPFWAMNATVVSNAREFFAEGAT